MALETIKYEIEQDWLQDWAESIFWENTALEWIKKMLYEKLVLTEKEKIFDNVNTEKIKLIQDYINKVDSKNLNDTATAILEILTQKEVATYLNELKKQETCPWDNTQIKDIIIENKFFREIFLEMLKWANANAANSLENNLKMYDSLNPLKTYLTGSQPWLNENQKTEINKIDKNEILKIRPFLDFVLSANWKDNKVNILENANFWSDVFSWNLTVNWQKIKLPVLETKTCLADWNLNENFCNELNKVPENNKKLLEQIKKENSEAEQWNIDSKEEYKWNYYYKQYDEKWASKSYGSWTMESSACWPTSFAMVASKLTGKEILPTETAKWSVENWYRINWVWTSFGFLTDAGNIFGWLKCTELWDNTNSMINKLKAWETVITSAQAGYFTRWWHYIVFDKISADGSQIYVLDPASESKNWWYSVNDLIQKANANNFWSYSK